jgi:hypothetical protein
MISIMRKGLIDVSYELISVFCDKIIADGRIPKTYSQIVTNLTKLNQSIVDSIIKEEQGSI